jgi:hypothetical protein
MVHSAFNPTFLFRNDQVTLDSNVQITKTIEFSCSIHDDVIICAYVTTPFDKLRVTGHGEPVEPCSWYSFGNDSHAQLFMTLCIVNAMRYALCAMRFFFMKETS